MRGIMWHESCKPDPEWRIASELDLQTRTRRIAKSVHVEAVLLVAINVRNWAAIGWQLHLALNDELLAGAPNV